ncbi:GNAT family N-acetyltransferase [Salibacterium salarium]|uniref:GNAT family N-acetyltransferase n=1 Tax=Salibacterium salarium TaxID=284579 RepID=A0A3R9PBG4_9BACI|nr:GNAT family N-acetyltransferase [Salibacterium salarium]RSL34708.1 GNAT family N-acetyltransferase [Salibacterium salarium]
MDVVIRPIEKPDLKYINEIRHQPSVIDNTMALPSERIETTEHFFNSLSKDDHVMVAEINERVVGIATLEARSGKLRYSGNISLIVHEEFQGKKIGALLIDTLLEIADKHLGLIRLELDVNIQNEKAISLYKKKGFEIEGNLKKAHFSNGKFHDVIIMGRVREIFL